MADSLLDRRRFLQTSGLTVALGALVAACGGDSAEEGAPGRVGYAPAATPLPTVETNDVVYLRTATSIEQTLVEAYGRIMEMGVLDGAAATLLERIIEDHRATAATTAELTTAAGGEAYECANSWYVERVVTPVLATIEDSDDQARDTLTTIDGMESMAGAMYQQMVELFTSQELRAEGMRFGATAARHSAAVAIQATGAPDAYAIPTLTGGEVTPDETGLVPIYAISTQFGSLTAIPITIGAASDAGVRTTFSLETPAANSFVYEGETCQT